MTRRQLGLRVTRRASKCMPTPKSAHPQDPLCSEAASSPPSAELTLSAAYPYLPFDSAAIAAFATDAMSLPVTIGEFSWASTSLPK